MGSMLDARRAGKYAASNPVIATSAAANANTAGLVADIP